MRDQVLKIAKSILGLEIKKWLRKK
jgi:hypothetical protein